MNPSIDDYNCYDRVAYEIHFYPRSTIFRPTVTDRCDDPTPVGMYQHCFNVGVVLLSQIETEDTMVVVWMFRKSQTCS